MTSAITPEMLGMLPVRKPARPAPMPAAPFDLGTPLAAIVEALPPELREHADLLAAFVASGDPSIIDERDESPEDRRYRRVPYDLARNALGDFAFPRDRIIPVLSRAEKAARALVMACVDRRNELREYDPNERAHHARSVVRELELALAELTSEGGA